MHYIVSRKQQGMYAKGRKELYREELLSLAEL